MTVTVQNDAPSKLHARRQIMAVSVRREGAEAGRHESKKAYAERTKDAKYPCVEKLFREIAPKYKARNAEEELRRWLHPHSQERARAARRRRDGHS